jgi:hypothetical protein
MTEEATEGMRRQIIRLTVKLGEAQRDKAVLRSELARARGEIARLRGEGRG